MPIGFVSLNVQNAWIEEGIIINIEFFKLIAKPIPTDKKVKNE